MVNIEKENNLLIAAKTNVCEIWREKNAALANETVEQQKKNNRFSIFFHT